MDPETLYLVLLLLAGVLFYAFWRQRRKRLSGKRSGEKT